MDIGCTFPAAEHTNAFLATCKRLSLSTVAFRGSVKPSQLNALQELSQEEFGHSLKCLRRIDIRLSGTEDEALATLNMKLNLNIAEPTKDQKSESSSNSNVAEDADLLVLHLDVSDPSVLGNPAFGDLLLASQVAVTRRRGPGSRLIVINLDCFVVAEERGKSKVNPVSPKAFALWKPLAKCNDLVFELSYLPWIRKHVFGGTLLQASQNGENEIQSESVVQLLRSTTQDIIVAYQKPVLLSSGQIKSENGHSNVAIDFLMMRAHRDIAALASVLMQLNRPLVGDGLAVLRRLKQHDILPASPVQDKVASRLATKFNKQSGGKRTRE